MPITADPRVMFFSAPQPPFLVRPLVILQDQHIVAKHLADGRIMVTDLGHGADGSGDDDAARERLADVLGRFLPPLHRLPYPQAIAGAYDVTPDNQLVVGPVEQRPGLWIAAGTNGRGMMLAPSVGRMIARAITGDEPDGILSDLLPVRFSDGRVLRAESQML